MKLLLDTNVLIPLEPTSVQSIEEGTDAAIVLVRTALRVGAQLFVHPAQDHDISRDLDVGRRELRKKLLGKYLLLEFAPKVSDELSSAIGTAMPGSNDDVDHLLLAAPFENAVHYLVTEDKGLHKKAKKAGIENQVLSIDEAIGVLGTLFERPTLPPPAVEAVPSHALDRRDPIWESFRQDYEGFDDWFRRAQQAHRPSWIIHGQHGYAAVALVKPSDNEVIKTGKVAKLCTFKVDSSYNGLRYGELLLKTLFEYLTANSYDWVYVTAYEKYEKLLQLLGDFGFEPLPRRTSLGEIVLAKPLNLSSAEENLEGLQLNIRVGPLKLDLSRELFAVPIKPHFHRVLFPELETQHALLAGEHPFGNSIRKAYLCHSPKRDLPPGSVLAFYRSQDLQAFTCVGVVERTLRSRDPAVIATAVGKRSVYSFGQISQMCGQEVLAILFRQSLPFKPPARLEELVDKGILQNAPISITRLNPIANSWMMDRLRQ